MPDVVHKERFLHLEAGVNFYPYFPAEVRYHSLRVVENIQVQEPHPQWFSSNSSKSLAKLICDRPDDQFRVCSRQSSQNSHQFGVG